MGRLTKLASIGILGLTLVGCASKKEETKNVKGNEPIYSSYGMDSIMQGSRSPFNSREILSNWQIERRGEWTLRNREFLSCDLDNSGDLNETEAAKYVSLSIFNYNFR